MYNESNWLCNYLDGCRKYTNEILHLDYVKDIKEVMFNSTKTEREKIRARYSAKVPDALTNQFPDRRKKEEAIIHHAERKQARTELFPAGIFMQLYIIATMMVNTVIKSMFVTSMAENYIALICLKWVNTSELTNYSSYSFRPNSITSNPAGYIKHYWVSSKEKGKTL